MTFLFVGRAPCITISTSPSLLILCLFFLFHSRIPGGYFSKQFRTRTQTHTSKNPTVFLNDPQKQEIGGFSVIQERRATDFEAHKM